MERLRYSFLTRKSFKAKKRLCSRHQLLSSRKGDTEFAYLWPLFAEEHRRLSKELLFQCCCRIPLEFGCLHPTAYYPQGQGVPDALEVDAVIVIEGQDALEGGERCNSGFLVQVL